MTDKTDIAALKRPVRDRYDWSNAVWRDCDQCGKQHTGTVTAEDGSQICAHCADQLYWSAWQVLAERALDQLEVVSKSEWKLAGDLTELQMNYNALQKKDNSCTLGVGEGSGRLFVHGDYDSIKATQKIILECDALKAKLANPVVLPEDLHPQTAKLVINFASALAEKLHKAEQKYGYSDTWMQPHWQIKCLNDFNHHVSKGDPRDVAAYCAFMWYHGWSTAVKGE